ncbi:2-dehydropantoate 2-reductase [Virgibacillus salarius]|uniref:ketopantoate reductase family protein n=1 Tax=Virgibacillus salarius TaxID=447199 RepID=UPI0031DEA668
MKVLIVGSGAMGSLFAGKLKQHGVDITLLNRPNSHIKAIQKTGLQIVEQDGNLATIDLMVKTNAADLNNDYDLILLFVKAFATESVLSNVLPFLSRTTPILTLQNGVGNMEKIQKLSPSRNVVVGGTSTGAGIVKPGVVEQRAWGSTFIGSTVPEKYKQLLEQIASLFSAGGIKTHVSENVQSVIWSKLIVNVAYNGLTAVTRLTNGEAIRTDEGKELVAKLVTEAVQIAERKGILLLYDDPINECIRLGIEEIGKNTSSMLTDVLNKRKTEVEVINGAIVKEGKKHNMATPYNEMILKLVYMIENSYEQRL